MRTLIALALASAFACGGKPGGDQVWHPKPGTSWQWQLSGTLDTSVAVTMYDVDLAETPEDALQSLRGRGVKIICYFSAGSREKGRPDVAGLPAEVVGNVLDGWPDENWLDVRAEPVRALQKARLDRAVERGCDGVEPDNVDAYANDSGFPLTAADQVAFNRFLAREAHARGLSVGLKNDLDQVGELVRDFDWALNEQCAEFDECDSLEPFIAANKAVFHVEYGDDATATTVCPAARTRRFSTLIKKLDLDAFRIACDP